MAWRFRKSFTVMPGLRLNVSKGGLSASIGSSPFSVQVGPRGVYANANIPGMGVSMRSRQLCHLRQQIRDVPAS